MATTPYVVSYQDVRWSTLATIPESSRVPVQLPIPGTEAFNKARGRGGDLVLIQLKSGKHLSDKRKAALRSLGLSRVWSTSIRNSSDPNLIGYIRTVKDVIAAIELPGVEYKSEVVSPSDIPMEYEKHQYGSNTSPGVVVRNSEGDYFVGESEGAYVSLQWSSGNSLVESVDKLRGLYPPLRDRVTDDQEEDGSTLVLRRADSDRSEYLYLPASEALAVARDSLSSVISASLAFEDDLSVFWHRPYSRFIDGDHSTAEVGVYGNGISPKLIREFARATAAFGFFDQAPITYSTRTHEKVRTHKI